MGNKVLGLLLLFCLATFSAQAQVSYEDETKQHPFYAEIQKTAEKIDGIELVQYLNKKIDEDTSRIHPVSIWLRDHSITVKDASKINSLYFLPYSDITFLLARTYKETGQVAGYKALGKSAIMTLYTYEVMAMADAIRCADASVISAVASYTLSERLLNPDIIATYKEFKKTDFDMFAEIAMLTEEQFAARPRNDDICAMGADRANDLMSHPDVKVLEVDDPAAPNGKRQDIIEPEGYVYHPKYLTDDEWKTARAKLRGEIAAVWKERYAEHAGVPEEKKP